MPDGPWYSTRAESSPRQSHAGHSHLRTGSPACPGPGTQTRLLFLFSFDKGKTGGCMSISCRSVQTARANINGSLLRRSSFPWALSSQQPLLSDGSSLRSWTNFLGRGLLRPRGTNSSRLFSPSDAVTKDFFLNAGPYVRVCVCVCVCVCTEYVISVSHDYNEPALFRESPLHCNQARIFVCAARHKTSGYTQDLTLIATGKLYVEFQG